jgi:hypothetical protein
MFHAKYLSSSFLDFLNEDFVSFLSFAMTIRVLHGIKFFEQFLKVTTKGTFLCSLDEIGSVVHEEMLFKVRVYRTNCNHKSSLATL